jgi:hypothetical protein
VLEVRGEDAMELSAVQHHDVVQTLSADAADHPFDVGVTATGCAVRSTLPRHPGPPLACESRRRITSGSLTPRLLTFQVSHAGSHFDPTAELRPALREAHKPCRDTQAVHRQSPSMRLATYSMIAAFRPARTC